MTHPERDKVEEIRERAAIEARGITWCVVKDCNADPYPCPNCTVARTAHEQLIFDLLSLLSLSEKRALDLGREAARRGHIIDDELTVELRALQLRLNASEKRAEEAEQDLEDLREVYAEWQPRFTALNAELAKTKSERDSLRSSLARAVEALGEATTNGEWMDGEQCGDWRISKEVYETLRDELLRTALHRSQGE